MSRQLLQALSGLEPIAFELLITQILKARFPGMDIHHIDGKSGDTGLDIVSGNLEGQPNIWQCKHFVKIQESQKAQIRGSFREALKHYTPKRWILCIPIDMDARTLRWFQRFATSQNGETEISLFAASEIIQELLYRPSISEQFFPGCAANFSELREIVMKSSELSELELQSLAQGNAQSLLARLEAKDARFAYEVSFARNRQPGDSSTGIATISSGPMAIDVFPRDLRALRENPPSARITLKGAGVKKFLEARRLGIPQKFSADELEGIVSDFDHLFPMERKWMTLEVTPNDDKKVIPIRVTFGSGDRSDVYEYIGFQITRAGTEEIELQSTSDLPLPITLICRPHHLIGSVSFADKTKGTEIDASLRQLRAIASAIESGLISFYDLEIGKSLVQAHLDGPVPEWLIQEIGFLEALRPIAVAYSLPLYVPKNVTKEDLKTLDLLASLLSGFDLPNAFIDFEMIKTHEPDPAIRAMISNSAKIQIVTPSLAETPELFGSKIQTGPVRYSVPAARFENPEAISEFLDRAEVGTTVRSRIVCDGPVRVERISKS